MSVVAQEKSRNTKEAFALVNAKIAEVKALLKTNGIDDKDIQSVNISINPNYNYDDGKTTIDGFIATHGLSIKIRKLESVDAVLEGVSAVANLQIQSTSYDIDDKTPLYTSARELAIAKAKQKAQDMARASGITLGRILSISESQGGYTPPMYNQYMAVANVERDQSGGGGVSAGQLEITTNVSITYEIK